MTGADVRCPLRLFDLAPRAPPPFPLQLQQPLLDITMESRPSTAITTATNNTNNTNNTTYTDDTSTTFSTV